MQLDDLKIAVIGLGYVGLPLAIEFGTKFPTLGFDINENRVAELERGEDSTLEVEAGDFARASQLRFSGKTEALQAANFYVVSVPTPIDANKRPELGPLEGASREVGKAIREGDIVVFESTVYPGATEEVCVPILEQESGLKFNQDFFVGYSPERINPGDKEHRLRDILKVTSGSTPEVATFVDQVYAAIIVAGTYLAPSIRVAEAAKVIENTQRDLNISLMNELAIIFGRLNIDTLEVLEAAETKWNFLPFRPGLVGGHCIGVDPYYLTHKAEATGYNPEVILAGRRINDGMGAHIAGEVIKLMARKNLPIAGGRCLVLGLAFKENCPDIRNTKVVDLISELEKYNVVVEVTDPWVDEDAAQNEYGISLNQNPQPASFDAMILAVAHDQFKELGSVGIRAFGKAESILYDVKSVLEKDAVDSRL